MSLLDVFRNQTLVACLTAWILAQVLKLPVEFAHTHRWNWALLLRAGGMPSSHSALVTAVAHSVGVTSGFGSPAFALAVAVAMVVIYDATGIRRQAGKHAEVINTMVQELVEGHPLRQEQLREVLGHSPGEAIVGVILGLVVSLIIAFIWPG